MAINKSQPYKIYISTLFHSKIYFPQNTAFKSSKQTLYILHPFDIISAKRLFFWKWLNGECVKSIFV